MSDNLKDVKKTKHNTKPKRPAKQSTWLQKRKFAQSWRNKEVSQTFIDELIDKIRDHFFVEDNTCFIKFLTDLGIRFDSFILWCKTHERLEDEYRYILNLIGARREAKAIYKKYNTNPGVITDTLRHYHPFWRKSYDENAELKKATQDDKTVIQYIYQEPLTTDTEEK